MAATVALDIAVEKAVEMIESMFDVRKTRARVKNASLKYYGTHQALVDTSWLSVVDNPKDPTKWLRERRQLGLALGRFIAHEVRHLYLSPHAADGLGSDTAEVLAATNNQHFSAVDQRNILNAIANLERTQSRVRVVPTFPLQQRTDFPF